MKYNFKPDLAFRELDHKLRKLISENGLYKHPVVLPITTNPTTYVAAHILKESIPESCVFVYFKDNIYHNDVMDNMVNEMKKTFDTRFEVVDAMNDCKEYLLYINEINTINDKLIRLKMQTDAIYMWIITNYEYTPLLINGLDSRHVTYNIGTIGYAINIFANLTHWEVLNMGIDKFKLNKDTITNWNNESNEVLLFNSSFCNISDENNRYTEKYRIYNILENKDMNRGYDTNRNIYLSKNIFYDK